MRSIYPIIALLLSFSLTLFSCDQEILDSVVEMNNGVCTFSFKNSKSEHSYGWAFGDSIGISAYKAGTNEIYSDYGNKKFIANRDYVFYPATVEDQILRPFVADKVDFVAFYPYKAIVSDKYLIDLRNQSSQKDIDFLYSDNANSNVNNSREIKLVFEHALSKIVINSIPGNGYTSTDLEGMSIIIKNINLIAAFDVRSKFFDVFEAKTSIMMNQTNNNTSEAIVLPGSSSDLRLKIDLANDNTYETVFPNEQYFDDSNIYFYNLKIHRSSVELSSVEIADWTGIENEPDTCATKKPAYEIGDFYPDPDEPATAIGIVYWLKQGSDGRDGKIVSFDTEILPWAVSNNYKLGTSVSVGANNAQVISNIDPTLQQFPAFKWCADKGPGWFLPSKYELHLLNEQWTLNENKINNNISLMGGEILSATDIYLSSSESREYPNNNVETYHFDQIGWPTAPKTTPVRIRAVKNF
jgi:hypothetical protein